MNKERISFAVVILIWASIFGYLKYKYDDCAKKGGVAVPSASGRYVCVRELK